MTSDQLDTPSTESQVLYMYKQGHTIDHIAKELDLGHTEVELIIKFNEKYTNNPCLFRFVMIY